MKKIFLVLIVLVFCFCFVKFSKISEYKNVKEEVVVERSSFNYMLTLEISSHFQTGYFSLRDFVIKIYNYFIKLLCSGGTLSGNVCKEVTHSRTCPNGMYDGVSASNVKHCAINRYNSTSGMEIQGDWGDGCCICYAWAYWKKINGFNPGTKYYNQSKCMNCNEKQTESHGVDASALQGAYKYIIGNNKPVVVNIKNSQTDQSYGHWVVLIGVTEESYKQYLKDNNRNVSMSDFLIREVYDGHLYNGSTSMYGIPYYLTNDGVYY